MTTATIAAAADTKGLAGSDMDLQVLLRRNVIPAFLEDVGYVSWRRQATTASVALGARYFALATANFWHMKTVALATEEETPLNYIGDDEVQVLKAEANTTNAKPTGYYMKIHTDGTWRAYFDAPFDSARTVAYVYDTNILFADDTTVVNLDIYIPSQFQWALVEGLKAEIFYDRYGVGDDRYTAAKAKRDEWVQRARNSPELSRGSSRRNRYVE